MRQVFLPSPAQKCGYAWLLAAIVLCGCPGVWFCLSSSFSGRSFWVRICKFQGVIWMVRWPFIWAIFWSWPLMYQKIEGGKCLHWVDFFGAWDVIWWKVEGGRKRLSGNSPQNTLFLNSMRPLYWSSWLSHLTVYGVPCAWLKDCWLCLRSFCSICWWLVMGSQVVPLSWVSRMCVRPPAMWGLIIALIST